MVVNKVNNSLRLLIGNIRKRRNSLYCKGFILSIGNFNGNKITVFSLNVSCNAVRPSFAEDGIAFPMTEAGAVFSARRTVMN